MVSRIEKLELEVTGLNHTVTGLNNAVNQLVQVVADLKQPIEVGVNEDAELKEQNVGKATRKKQPFGKVIKSMGKSFLLNTTIHGVGRVVSTQRYVIRLLWMLMIGLTAYFCIYTLYRNLNDYMDFDVINAINQIQEEQVVFPAVTVCAKMKANKKQVDLDFEHITKCRFDDVDCSITDIERFTRDKGKFWCLRFNGYHQIPRTNQTNPLKTITDLESTGFKLILDVDVSAFRLYIQDNYLNTYKNSCDYTIEKNELSTVYVTKTVDKNQGEPHNSCEVSSDVAYRQSNCKEQCVHKAIAEAYNCSLVYGYNAVRGLSECARNISRLKSYYMIKCDKNCPKECESTTWSATIQPRCIPERNVNRTTIRVHLERMNHIEISQRPKTTFWDLLASLGGTLGFLGMSFLTFVEIFELVLELIRNLFS